MRKSDDDIRDSKGFYDAVENLDEDLKKNINDYIKFYNTQRVTLKMGLKIPA